MGARSSIVVRFGKDAAIHLYSHDHGREVPEALRRGIVRALQLGRAGDAGWLAGLFAEEMRRMSGAGPGEPRISPSRTYVDREYGEWHVDPGRGIVQHVDAYISWHPEGAPILVEHETAVALSFREVAEGAGIRPPELPWS